MKKRKHGRFFRSNNWTRSVKPQDSAFTLVELLIVMAVILTFSGWLLQEHAKLSKPLVTQPADGYNGGYAGIGIKLEKDDQSGAILITKVAPDSPAAAAKLSAGLIVQKIDGAPTCGKSILKCQLLMRGIAGTKVRLDLVNPNGDGTEVVELTRIDGVNWSS